MALSLFSMKMRVEPPKVPDRILVRRLLARLVAIRYERNGSVAGLYETPRSGTHHARDAVRVVPGKGFAGDHARKSFYRGRLVPGREVTAVASEVLDVLHVDPQRVGDNLITAGIDLGKLEPGDRVRVGEVELVRSEAEHRPCTVFRDRTSPEAFAAISRERFRGALFTVAGEGVIRRGDAILPIDRS